MRKAGEKRSGAFGSVATGLCSVRASKRLVNAIAPAADVRALMYSPPDQSRFAFVRHSAMIFAGGIEFQRRCYSFDK